MKRLTTALISVVLLLGFSNLAAAYKIADDAIGGDCTQIGYWDTATKTCTLTTDIYVPEGAAISIDSDYVILDGNGHRIYGNKWRSKGVILTWGRTGVTVRNLVVENFYFGIRLEPFSTSNRIENSVVTGCLVGIYGYYSYGNQVLNNFVSSNYMGIIEVEGWYNFLTGNTVANNDYGIKLYVPWSRIVLTV